MPLRGEAAQRPLLPSQATEYADFLPELKRELEASTLPGRELVVCWKAEDCGQQSSNTSVLAGAIDVLFSESSAIYPTCAGHWLVSTCCWLYSGICRFTAHCKQEFGVWNASTINAAAEWRASHCAASCPWCFGFDTFQGARSAAAGPC